MVLFIGRLWHPRSLCYLFLFEIDLHAYNSNANNFPESILKAYVVHGEYGLTYGFFVYSFWDHFNAVQDTSIVSSLKWFKRHW